MNDSVKQLASRFDKFQGSIDAKINKMHGEIVILKNKVQVLESNVKPSGMQSIAQDYQSTHQIVTNRNGYNVGIEGESISARGDNDYPDNVPIP